MYDTVKYIKDKPKNVNDLLSVYSEVYTSEMFESKSTIWDDQDNMKPESMIMLSIDSLMFYGLTTEECLILLELYLYYNSSSEIDINDLAEITDVFNLHYKSRDRIDNVDENLISAYMKNVENICIHNQCDVSIVIGYVPPFLGVLLWRY